MKSMLFDHIYLVNLPQYRGNRLKALAHLKTFDIEPTVFKASDGYMPSLLDRYNSYSKQEPGTLSYFRAFNKLERDRSKRFIESAGAFGYIDTYIRILKDAKSKGYQSILIFEDDVLLSRDFKQRLECFGSVLPKTWKFLSLGASQYNWDSVNLKKAKLKGFYTPKQLDTCGSFAIAIRSTIFDELVELQSHFEAPFDHLPLGEIYNRYPTDCLVAYPYMVMPDVRSSSIRGSRNQLIHAKKMKWGLSLFDYPLVRPIINLILASKEQSKYLDLLNDESTLPFELHIYIPSLDGLRPYHHSSQSIELVDKSNMLLSPNSGICVRSKAIFPITESDLISLYESIISDKPLNSGFEEIDAQDVIIDRDRVSVIIPTYKRSDNLTNVVLSVLEQDYDNKEIIIVDDNPVGSADQLDTKHMIDQLIREHSKEKIIYISHTRNRNGAGARNTGFLKSTGNYICFLDDDDLYLPGRLSLSVNKLKNTASYIGAVYCGFIGWNGATQVMERYRDGNLTLELLSLDYLSHYLHTNTATYKRSAVSTINGFDETFLRHQDLEFNLRFFEHYDMDVVPEQLIHLRPKHTQTNNQQFGINLFKTKLKFLKKFEYIINRYDLAIQKTIYDTHWSEVVKYASNEKEFANKLLSDFNNGSLQCFIRLKKMGIMDASKQEEKIEEVALLPVEVNEATTNTNSVDLSSWQEIGVKVFGIVFSRFFLPRQKRKLRTKPKAFFEDSRHNFTRFVGRLLKII